VSKANEWASKEAERILADPKFWERVLLQAMNEPSGDSAKALRDMLNDESSASENVSRET